jgi:hypothetical protein
MSVRTKVEVVGPSGWIPPSPTDRLAGGLCLLYGTLAGGCSCEAQSGADTVGDASETDTAVSTGPDSSGPVEPCPHVYFTDVDFQWTLDAAAQDLVVADLDGDGLPELIVTRDRQPLVVLRNRGRGNGSKTFDVPIPVEGWNPVSVAVTDWNMDGRPDLVAVGSRVILFENESGLSFRAVNDVPLEHISEYVAVADMNGDGREDIIVYGGRGMAIYPAPNADGVLGDPFSLDLGALGLRRGDVADLDGDGVPDLAVAAWGDDPFLVIAHGDGAGGFERIRQYAGPTEMRSLEAAVVDVDADGILRLLRQRWPARHRSQLHRSRDRVGPNSHRGHRRRRSARLRAGHRRSERQLGLSSLKRPLRLRAGGSEDPSEGND